MRRLSHGGGGGVTLERGFLLANALALPGWIALLLAPLNRTAMLRTARAVGLLLAAGYLIGFVASLGSAKGLADDYSLSGIAGFFADPRLALVGWVHYLAFDLWVGAWEVEVAGREGMPALLILPALALTFLLGPIGLLVFLTVRVLYRRRRLA